MNAYELADLNDWACCANSKEVSAMLRQQADRIAELEKEIKRLVGAEPITYGKLTFCKNCGQQDPYAQTKPLSDEEIADMVCSGEYWKVDGLTITSVDFDKFARAIEERHGIK